MERNSRTRRIASTNRYPSNDFGTGSSSGSGTSSKKKVAGNGGQHAAWSAGQQASHASGQAKMAAPRTKPQSPRKAGRGRKRPLDKDAEADPTTGTATGTDSTTSTSSTNVTTTTSRRLVFLLGHSFVRRLEQYIFSDNKSFNLEDFNVVMKGFSGAHMSTLQ